MKIHHWLWGTPLLVLAFSYFVQARRNERWLNIDVGGFKSAVVGERNALKKLSQLTSSGQAYGRVRIHWDVSMSSTKPGRTVDIWLYGTVYDVPASKLTFYFAPPDSSSPTQVQATEYNNINGEVIQLVARTGGGCSDLVKNGGVLGRRGKATFVNGRGPAFDER